MIEYAVGMSMIHNKTNHVGVVVKLEDWGGIRCNYPELGGDFIYQPNEIRPQHVDDVKLDQFLEHSTEVLFAAAEFEVDGETRNHAYLQQRLATAFDVSPELFDGHGYTPIQRR